MKYKKLKLKLKKSCNCCFSRSDCLVFLTIRKFIHVTIDNMHKLDAAEDLIGEICESFDKGTKENNIHLFFNSHRRLQFFKNDLKTPKSIIQHEQEILNLNLERLKKYFGIDGMKYLQDEGSVEYMIFCESHAQEQIDQERCYRCIWWSSNDDPCEKDLDGKLSCEEFRDCGYDMNERIQLFQLSRCGSCSNCEVVTEMMDLEVPKCVLKKNMLKPKCDDYKEKEGSVE
jgi:hypothetical protein